MASSESGQRLVALYGLLMAMVPALMMETPFETAVSFTGAVSVMVTASHDDGTLAGAESEPAAVELTGDLCDVIDSLSGRGRAVEDALPGAPELLGVLAGVLRS